MATGREPSPFPTFGKSVESVFIEAISYADQSDPNQQFCIVKIIFLNATIFDSTALRARISTSMTEKSWTCWRIVDTADFSVTNILC
jgi:hypothetical protein